MDLEVSFMDEEDKREVKQTKSSLVLLLLLLLAALVVVLRWCLSLSIFSDFFYFFVTKFQNKVAKMWSLVRSKHSVKQES